MAGKSVAPSIKEKAFDCPYCGAYTTQTWFKIRVESIHNESKIPYIANIEDLTEVISCRDMPDDEKEERRKWYIKRLSGKIFLEEIKGAYFDTEVCNLFLSQCYHCDKVAIWVYSSLVYPPLRHGADPNQDLPEDVLRDYEEARSILDLSPRGAAALLRLSIQKICKFLGETGKNIDADIASLVSKGLNPLVKKSLDVVRVIGNEAVHPGTMDLKDDRDTATTLFCLVNVIAEQMITHPKTINAMYDKLPDGKKDAIDARDGKV